MIDIQVEYVQIDNFNQTERVISKAQEVNAGIIAVRIYNSDDYDNVISWLEESKTNKAILFHSTSYPYGYKLFREFPEQTSFDDINPVII